MRLRIVTATRGNSAFWDAAVDSIARAAPGAEHVVVCPADAAANLAKAKTRPRIVVEREPGLYPNIAAGLAVAGETWDAFTWLNDDDLLVAPGFALLVSEIERQPDVDIAYGRVALIDGHGARIGALPIARRARDLGALLCSGIMPLAQPGTVIRREICQRLGGFALDFRLAGDLDLFVRALAAGARFHFADAEVAAFRLRREQLSKQAAAMAAETARALRGVPRSDQIIAAKWRFRFDNLGVYLERLRRHGWVSMRQMYDRVE